MNKMTEEHKRVVNYCIMGMRDEIKELLSKETYLTDGKAGRIIYSTANKWFAIAKNRCKGISKNELGIYWKTARRTKMPFSYAATKSAYYIS